MLSQAAGARPHSATIKRSFSELARSARAIVQSSGAGAVRLPPPSAEARYPAGATAPEMQEARHTLGSAIMALEVRLLRATVETFARALNLQQFNLHDALAHAGLCHHPPGLRHLGPGGAAEPNSVKGSKSVTPN